jgi:hypothetical protein
MNTQLDDIKIHVEYLTMLIYESITISTCCEYIRIPGTLRVLKLKERGENFYEVCLIQTC